MNTVINTIILLIFGCNSIRNMCTSNNSRLTVNTSSQVLLSGHIGAYVSDAAVKKI